MTAFPDAAAWRAACADDAVAGGLGRPLVGLLRDRQPAMTRRTFAFVDGRVSAGRRRPAVHPGRARRGLGEVPAADPTAPPSRHLRHACTACRSSRSTANSWRSCSTPTSSAGCWRSASGWRWAHAAPAPVTLAPRGGPRAVPAVTGGYVPVTVARHDLSDLLRNRRHRPRRAVHAHRRRRRPAVPRPDGRSAHHRRPSPGRLRPALARQVAAARGRRSPAPGG